MPPTEPRSVSERAANATAATAAPASRDWRKIILGAALLVGGIAAMVLLVGDEAPEIWAALSSTSLATILLLTLLTLPGMITRTEAWRASVEATREVERSTEPVPRRAMYLANSFGLIANQVSVFLGLGGKIAALRRFAPDSPNITRLIAAEVPVNLVEAGVAGVMLLIALLWLGLPVWIAVALGGAVALLGLAALKLSSRRRLDDINHWLHGLAMLQQPRRLAIVCALMLFTLLLTSWRIQLSLSAFDVEISFAQAILALLLTGTLGALGLGPSAVPGGLLIIFSGAGVAQTTSAGLLALGTTVLAAAAFCLIAALPVWERIERRAREAFPRASEAKL